MNELVQYDHKLFLLINNGYSHPWLDQAMTFITDLHHVWWITQVLLPLFLFFWVSRAGKSAVAMILGIALTAGATDHINSQYIKKNVKRDRPPLVLESAQLRVPKHSGYSFPSNHAANNFAVAQYVGLFYPHMKTPLFLIATAVAVSRVYVGVHFPSDVVAGALVGLVIGTIMYWLSLKLIMLYGRINKSSDAMPRPPRGLRRR